MRVPQSLIYFAAGLIASVGVYYAGTRWILPQLALVQTSALTQTQAPSHAAVPTPLSRAVLDKLPGMKSPMDLVLDPGQPIRATIGLGMDWKLNEKASNWMAWFERAPGAAQYKEVQELGMADLVTLELHLPILQPEYDYVLQGTLYSCKRGDNSVCAMNSYSYLIKTPNLPPGQGSQGRFSFVIR